MPKNEPDSTDPMELVAVGDDAAGADAALLAQCLAAELFGLGYSTATVVSLFRSPEYALAHRAWRELGETRVHQIVAELERTRRFARAHRGEQHA